MDLIGILLQSKLDQTQKTVDILNKDIDTLSTKLKAIKIKVDLSELKQYTKILDEFKKTTQNLNTAKFTDQLYDGKHGKATVKIFDGQEQQKVLTINEGLGKTRQILQQLDSSTGQWVQSLNEVKKVNNDLIDKSIVKEQQQLNQSQSAYWASVRKEKLVDMTGKSKELQDLANHYRELEKLSDRQNKRVVNMGTKLGGIGGLNFGDDDAMRSHVLSLQDAGTEITRFQRVTDAAGNSQIKMNLTTQTGNNMIRQQSIVVDQNTQSLYRQSEAIKPNINRMLGMVEQMGIAITRSIQWGLAMGLLYGNIRKLREGVAFIKELDGSLVQIQMVTGKTREETKLLSQEYAKLGKDLKTSIRDLSVASVSLYRQGLDDGQVKERLEVISKTAKTTAVDIKMVTDFITAGVNSTKMAAEDYSNILIKASSIAGTSFDELGEGMSKVVSAATVSGISVEKLTSYISTLSETTRLSASTLGQSLKTVIARFNALTDDGETNEDLNKIETAMKSVGITFRDSENQIRPVSDMLDELSGIWSTLSKNQQQYLSTQIAGVRQISTFQALMLNYNRSLEIQNELLDASGTLNQQYAKYLNSVEASAQSAKVAFEEMWINALNSDTIKYYYDFATVLTKVVDKLGLMNVAVFTLSFVLLTANKNFRAFATTLTWVKIQGFISNLKMLPWLFKTASVEMGVFKGGLFTLGVGFDILKIKAALMWGAVTLGASVAITLLANLLSKFTGWATQSRDVDSGLSTINSRLREQAQEIKIVNKLLAEKKYLEQQDDKTADQKQRLVDIEKELAKVLPQTTTAYNEQNEALSENAEAVSLANKAKLEQLETEATLIKNQYQSQIEDIEKQTKDAKLKREVYIEILGMIKPGDDKIDLDKTAYSWLQGDAERLKKMISDKMNIDIKDLAFLKNEDLDEYVQLIKDQAKIIGENTDNMDRYNEAVAFLENIYDATNSSASEFNETLKTTSNEIEIQYQNFEDLAKSIENVQKNDSLLAQAQDELNEHGNISIDTFLKLSNAYGDFGDIQEYNIETIGNFINVKKEDLRTTLTSEKEKTEATLRNSQLRIQAIKAEIEVLNAKIMLARGTIGLEGASKEIVGLNNELSLVTATSEEATKQLAKLNGLMNSIYVTEAQSSAKNTQKAADDKLKAIQDVESKIITIIKKRIDLEKKDLDDKLKDYEKFISDKMKLLEDEYDQEDYMKELQEERQKSADIQRLIDQYMLDDSLEARNKVKDLTSQLSEQEQKILEMSTKRTREERKKNLQQILQDEKDRVEEKKSILDEELSEDKLYLAAKQAILTNSIKGINGEITTLQSAFVDFENRFGAGLGILGDKIKNEFIEKIKLATGEIRNLDKAIGNSNTAFSNKTVSVQQPIIVNPTNKGGGGWDNMVGSYHDGGVIDKTGKAMVHGQPNSVETVFNATQGKALYDFVDNIARFTPKNPSFSGASVGATLNIDNLIHIEGNVDKSIMPSIEAVANKVMDKIHRQLMPSMTRM